MSKNKTPLKKGGVLGFGNKLCADIYNQKNKDGTLMLLYDALIKTNDSFKQKTGNNHVDFDELSRMFTIIYKVGTEDANKTDCKSTVNELKKQYGKTKFEKISTSTYSGYIDDFVEAANDTIKNIQAALQGTTESGTCGSIYGEYKQAIDGKYK